MLLFWSKDLIGKNRKENGQFPCGWEYGPTSCWMDRSSVEEGVDREVCLWTDKRWKKFDKGDVRESVEEEVNSCESCGCG